MAEANKIFVVHGYNRKIRIKASSYQVLESKVKAKLLIKKESKISFKLDDGSEIDEDYFDLLDDNTNLHIDKNSSYQPLINKIEEFLSNYSKKYFKNVDGQLQGLLNQGDLSKIFIYLGSIADQSSTLMKSSKSDHLLWFEGLNTKFVTKEAVLRNSAETRMRGYFQKLKKDLENCDNELALKHTIDNIHTMLKQNKYHGFYFDRSASSENRLCTDQGTFSCDGEFNCKDCLYAHTINPYESRESRVMFSTWNFDHVIEKSRSIIPALKIAFKNPSFNALNIQYIYDLLFKHVYVPKLKCRDGNLKLVHIVCHNKNPHGLECDKNKLFFKLEDSVDSHIMLKRKETLKLRSHQPKKKLKLA